ncbi:hypothetical protein C0206_08795, partial [Moraxella catarrhalis]|nr:hypothetical protein [Moraxella catarrhalis]
MVSLRYSVGEGEFEGGHSGQLRMVDDTGDHDGVRDEPDEPEAVGARGEHQASVRRAITAAVDVAVDGDRRDGVADVEAELLVRGIPDPGDHLPSAGQD